MANEVETEEKTTNVDGKPVTEQKSLTLRLKKLEDVQGEILETLDGHEKRISECSIRR